MVKTVKHGQRNFGGKPQRNHGKGRSEPHRNRDRVIKNFDKGGRKQFSKGGGKNLSKGKGKRHQSKGKGKGRIFEEGRRPRRKGSAKGSSSKGFGKRDRSQPQGGFQKLQKGGRKGFRKGSSKRRQDRGNDQARGQPVKKSAFQKPAFQTKIGKFARRGALRNVQRDGERRKGAGKGKGDGERRKGAGKGKGGSKGRGFMARRRSSGPPMGKAGQKPKLATLGKFASKARRSFGRKGGKGQPKGQGKGAGKWVFVPHGQSPKKAKGLAKGKGAGKDGTHRNPKVNLNNAITLLLGRDFSKGDCEYNVTEEKGRHIAIVTIPGLESERKDFKGQPAKTEQEAERSAAQKALQVLSTAIRKARAEKDGALRAARKQKPNEKKASAEDDKDTEAAAAA